MTSHVHSSTDLQAGVGQRKCACMHHPAGASFWLCLTRDCSLTPFFPQDDICTQHIHPYTQPDPSSHFHTTLYMRTIPTTPCTAIQACMHALLCRQEDAARRQRFAAVQQGFGRKQADLQAHIALLEQQAAEQKSAIAGMEQVGMRTFVGPWMVCHARVFSALMQCTRLYEEERGAGRCRDHGSKPFVSLLHVLHAYASFGMAVGVSLPSMAARTHGWHRFTTYFHLANAHLMYHLFRHNASMVRQMLRPTRIGQACIALQACSLSVPVNELQPAMPMHVTSMTNLLCCD